MKKWKENFSYFYKDKIYMLLLGLTLITEGMLNLITILTAVKIIRRKQPEIIDEDDIERWEES